MLKAALERISTPPRRYAVRVNTLKGDVDESVRYFIGIGVDCRAHEQIREGAMISVEGPFKVIADFGIVPIGHGVTNMGRYVATAISAINKANGLKCEITFMGR